MQPTEKHEETIVGLLTTELAVEYKKLKLPYFISKTAYSRNVLILNCPGLKNESLWKKYSTVKTSAFIPFIIEFVSGED